MSQSGKLIAVAVLLSLLAILSGLLFGQEKIPEIQENMGCLGQPSGSKHSASLIRQGKGTAERYSLPQKKLEDGQSV